MPATPRSRCATISAKPLAGTDHDPAQRKQALIGAAGWRGRVVLRAWRDGNAIVLEVTDNGAGMTEEVRRRCTETHFTTKRDNALYEGHNTGMGLGLSFVLTVLEHHHATLQIESQPLQGTTFRARFPAAIVETTVPTSRRAGGVRRKARFLLPSPLGGEGWG